MNIQAPTDNVLNYFDIQSLSTLKKNADPENNAGLKAVAQQLESVFLQMVLKSMHEANGSLKSEIYDRDQEKFFQDMLNQQMSVSLSKAGGIGLAEVIVKQLQHKPQSVQPLKPLALPVMSSPQNNIHLSPEEPVEKTAILEKPKVFLGTDDLRDLSKKPMQKIEDFIESLKPYAQKAASRIGIDPLLLLAQSALETGWGKHILENDSGQTSHNLFGIKAHQKWEGQHIEAKTQEYENNQAIEQKAKFKSYQSYADSFSDFVELIQSTRYEKALQNTDNPKGFLQGLHQGGYATDPNYVTKVLSIYEKLSSTQ